MRFDQDEDLEQLQAGSGSFSYSATKVSKLDASEYTLVTVVVDISGSVASYAAELEKCLQEIVRSCLRSPRADFLMLRIVAFNTRVEEIHGFKLLMNCNPDDYKGILHCGGGTALRDATYNAVEAANTYSKSLVDQDYSLNGIVFVITDGDDNASTVSETHVKEVLATAVKKEVMESMVSVLIGVDADPGVKQYLTNFHATTGMTQYVSMGGANERKLAKLAEFVSKSISSQSSSIGQGAASQPINMTF